MNCLGRLASIASIAAILASLLSCSVISAYLGLSPPAASTSGSTGQSTGTNGGTTSSGLTAVLSTVVKGSTATAPIPITVQFSAPVTDFKLTSLSITNGTASSLTATSSMEYHVSVMPSGNTTVSVSLPAGVVQTSSGATNEASNQLSVTFSEPLPAVSFTNVANNGLLETSLLLGTASGTNGITRVEISLDSGASTQATGTTSWSFRLPTGSGAWKYDSTHTVTIQAFDVTGNSSTPVTVKLRKGTNEDLNGDGYPDLVVGAPAANGSSGAVYLFYGSATGLSGAVSTSSANLVLSDSSATSFGAAIAVGDLNGDGYADVAVGAPGTASGAGAVYIYYGSASGLSSTPGTVLTGATASALGGSLAIGDVDGDGYGDLGVTAAGSGDAYIFYGGPTPMTGGTLPNVAPMTEFTSSNSIPVGNEIAFGDVNGDGNLDVAVGGASSSGNGQVFVILGSGSRLPASDDLATNPAGLAITTIGQEASGQGFGSSPIAFGDVNGDGSDDLVVGADEYPSSAVGNGRVYIFNGGASAFTAGATMQAANASAVITGPTGSNLGARISLGPVTLDGYDDLLAGAIDESVGTASSSYEQGHVYLFYGSAGGIATTDMSAGASADLTFTGAAGTLFGTMPRQLLDLNGDGLSDLLFGAPGASSNAGAVYLVGGSASGFSSVDLSTNPSAATATIGGAAGSQLGIGLN